MGPDEATTPLSPGLDVAIMRTRGPAAVAVGAMALLGACGGSDRSTLSVLAPEWLRPFMGAVAERYDAAQVKFRYLSDDQLDQEVMSGKNHDVVIAATDVLPSAETNPGVYENVRGVGSDQLVMVLPRGQRKLAESFDVADDKGVRLAAAKADTQLGRLTSSGISSLRPAVQQRLQANIRRRESSAAGVLRDVRDGSADAGFVRESDVNRSPAAIKLIFLPDGVAQAQSWQAGIRRKSQERDAARELVQSLFDGKAARQLRAMGLSEGPGQPGKTIPAG